MGSIRKLKEKWPNEIEIDEIYVQDALNNIEMLHKEDDGFIAVGQKMNKSWNQYHYKVDELKDNISKLLSLDGNLYMSPNSYFIPKRKIENIRHLNALYVDIDYYNVSKLRHLDHEYIIGMIENNYFKDKLIPLPSFIIFTGRGLAIYWLIEPVPSRVLPLWNAVQRHFLSTLSALGSDAKSIDSARVMRLAGSKHEATNQRAKLYIYDENLTYRLSEIQEDYLPALTPYVKNPSHKAKGRKAKVVNYYTLYSLHYSRINDLIKLIEIRNGYCRDNEGQLVEKGQREVMCFLYRYWYCCYSSNKEEALEYTLEFNSKFISPLTTNEVKKITQSAEAGYEEWIKDSPCGVYSRGGYNYSNKTLIKELNITQDEMKQLETIIDQKEKVRRNAEYKKAKRRNEDGLTARVASKEEKIKKVNELYSKGYKQKEIAEQLDLSKGLVTRYLKNLKNDSRKDSKDDKIKLIKKLYKKGYKQKEIAEELGISKGLVSRYLKLIKK